MKCPACHAHNEPDALTCNRCGRELPGERTSKETMMGLPGILAQRPFASQPTAPAREERSTLYGIRAITDSPADAPHEVAGGLDEATVAASEYVDDDLPPGSTRIAPQSVVDAALSGSFATQYGLPAVERPDPAPQPPPSHPQSRASHTSNFARAWGLEEESEESAGSSTQVAGAALVHAILESTHGAESFSKAGQRAPQQHHTLMWGELGVDPGADTPQERTKQVDEAQLAAIRRSATQKFSGVPTTDSLKLSSPSAHDPTGSPRSGILKPARPLAESSTPADPHTGADGGDRRKKILDKLRGNLSAKPTAEPAADPAVEPTAATPDETPASRDVPTRLHRPSTAAPARPDPAPPVRTTGPRFAIPQPSAQAPRKRPTPADDAFEPAAPDLLDIPVEPLMPPDLTGDLTGEPAPDLPVEALSVDLPPEPAAVGEVFVEPVAIEEAAPVLQESFVTIPREDDFPGLAGNASGHGAPRTAFAIPPSGGDAHHAAPAATATPASTRGVFDSLDGVTFGAEASAPTPAQSAAAPPAPSAQPTPDAPQAHAPDAPTATTSADLLRRLWPIFALLAILGVVLAAVGAIFLFAGDLFGITLPTALAATALGGGVALLVCAALFPLVLKWIS